MSTEPREAGRKLDAEVAKKMMGLVVGEGIRVRPQDLVVGYPERVGRLAGVPIWAVKREDGGIDFYYERDGKPAAPADRRETE